MAEKSGNKEKTDTTAAIQGPTTASARSNGRDVEYCEDDYVFAFGEAVIAADERPETHIISISVSNWSCARCVSERHSTAIVFD